MRTRRALLPAGMLEATGRSRRLSFLPVPPVRRVVRRTGGTEARNEALAKLRELFNSGVLTRQQFVDEKARLLGE